MIKCFINMLFIFFWVPELGLHASLALLKYCFIKTSTPYDLIVHSHKLDSRFYIALAMCFQ